MTEYYYLSGKDKDNTVEWDFFCTHGRNSGKWDKIEVPSNWEFQGYGSYLYGKVNTQADEKGLYRHRFMVPENWKGKRIFIVFEGSMTDAEVKINGNLAGPVHQGAFYRFKYDISSILNFKGENLLEVTVSKESANESINRAERMSDYWVFGGIFRPVYLEAVPEQFIDRVAIDAKADGSFRMDVFSAGSGKATGLNATVLTTDGKKLGNTINATLSNDGKTTIKGDFPGAATWDPEFPNMHRVVVELIKGKKVIHRYVQKFGFRTVELRESDGIYVNGAKVIFRGVCRHTFWPSSGRASSRQLAIDDVNLMKDMNMNAVRMSHYPPDQYFLDVCDSMGMFVLDELAGWQKFYDTPTAQRLVRQLVERDVNHPSVVLWDNGNEGGFNKEVRGDYALYDPQKRTVIEPWSIVNGTNTKHYPGYKYVENALTNGKEIFFPTEFLHGLYDGGHGAGLEDHWNLMMKSPLAAGAFLWVFADEGAERRDLNDSIDTEGNRAPDGILGPYHEKEGSFYTIKEIWSPVQFIDDGSRFTGKLTAENRYLYSNLSTCSYDLVLTKFKDAFTVGETREVKGGKLPDIKPGGKAEFIPDLPLNWKDYDILEICVYDRHGREIKTVTYPLVSPEAMARRSFRKTEDKIRTSETPDYLSVSSDRTEIVFSKASGLLTEVKYDGKKLSLSEKTHFTIPGATFIRLDHEYSGEGQYLVNMVFSDSSHFSWIMHRGGLLELNFDYKPSGELDYAGITFNYPEEKVKGAELMARGPYHSWKNRLRGQNFGLYNKEYNNTITGETWDYPEFKGYYPEFYGVKLLTGEVPITIVSAEEGLFLHLFTPGKALFSTREKGVRGEVNPPFPDGDISFLHGISPIGTKFTRAEAEGPQSQKNKYDGKTLKGTLYFSFGE